ncbi:MAG: YaiO family outer membrane beta-barrel protein [Gammaproteobacteria bacterium]
MRGREHSLSRRLLAPGRCAGALGGLLAALSAVAAPLGEIEAGGLYYGVNEGFEDTYGVYARGRLNLGKDEWLAEGVQLDRFGDDGFFGGLGNIHHFDERWFSQLAIGSSSGGFFWPELRIDANLSRRWGARKQLVTTAGVTYFDAKDIHSDTGFRVEGVYYSDSPWVLQGGVTYNNSEPGSVGSVSGYAAISHVVDGARIVSARLGGGEQAYQPFENDRFKQDISFGTLRVTCKQWVGRRWGINVAAESYFSDSYDQHGVEIGLFQEF